LLARRVTDSHTRKAAVELQALRDGLAKLGFNQRKERLEEKVFAHGHQPPAVDDVHAVRQCRPMRQTRLSTVQRLGLVIQNIRQQFEQTLGVEPKETVAEKIAPAESVKQGEAVTPPRTVREALRQRQAHRQQQRRSGGIHI
jgi:hypothetical protein